MCKYIIGIILLLLAISSCGVREQPKEMFYDSKGRVTKAIKYIGSDSLVAEIETYYFNGKIRSKYYEVRGQLNGEFASFDESGKNLSKGYYRDGVAIGPTYYYTNGNVSLYNERDLKGKVFYVLKYDPSKTLIKEEGICMSPNYLVESINQNSKRIIFSFAEPENCFNKLKAFMDLSSWNVKKSGGHVGEVYFSMPQDSLRELTIVSSLSNDSNIICEDTIKITIQ